MNLPRAALVTGVSRRRGIGFAICRRLLQAGVVVVGHGWTPHDAAQPWGADRREEVLGELRALGTFHALEGDLADAAVAARLVDEARAVAGPLDALVANHARSSQATLAETTADELDASWAVNARATVLLVQAFAAAHEAGHPGRIVLFTSGQHRGPMPGEIPYAVSKGAVQQMARTLADALADQGITVNAVNPGPVDTGWADPVVAEQVRRAFPRGRWTTPDEVAEVVAWLVSEEAGLLTGQTLDTEAGFRR